MLSYLLVTVIISSSNRKIILLSDLRSDPIGGPIVVVVVVYCRNLVCNHAIVDIYFVCVVYDTRNGLAWLGLAWN